MLKIGPAVAAAQVSSFRVFAFLVPRFAAVLLASSSAVARASLPRAAQPLVAALRLFDALSDEPLGVAYLAATALRELFPVFVSPFADVVPFYISRLDQFAAEVSAARPASFRFLLRNHLQMCLTRDIVLVLEIDIQNIAVPPAAAAGLRLFGQDYYFAFARFAESFAVAGAVADVAVAGVVADVVVAGVVDFAAVAASAAAASVIYPAPLDRTIRFPMPYQSFLSPS